VKLQPLIVQPLVDVPGYERGCGPGQACVFGTAWYDVDRNGCDTRNDVLARDLVGEVLRPGSDCVVVSGVLADPYTGETIRFVKERASAVQIDHVYALSTAWDAGAHAWTKDQRRSFANDPLNLLATDGPTNSSKQDDTPSQWRPPSQSGWCIYATRYVAVAAKYKLPVTPADRAALAELGATC